ncbi:MAG: hypothetical protein KAU99_03775 [Thermoplasmata archaeon]|nr:hypothetical protein [Thermoplasmata archaeon]MCK4455448.1 hypothetical protein [Thermoplasmata archaeon]
MNEKLGDHPLTDFLVHGRHPFPRHIERMTYAIHHVDPSALDDVAPKTFY